MTHPKQLHSAQFNRRQALMALVGSVALPGCGGGGSVAGLSSGGTGSFTSGVIIGLGSIIVNGIRYDDSSASVNGGTGTSSELKLGMVVSVQGSSVKPAAVAGGLATATASSISYESEWKGPVDSIDTTNNSFVMLGQTIKVLSTTVFDGEGVANLSNLATQMLVEVHGFIDPNTATLRASRVEIKASLSEYRLSGAISELDQLNTTFQLGDEVINFAFATDRPTSLQNDMMVKVDIANISTGSPWTATRIRSVDALAGISLEDDDEAEIEGSITAFTSSSVFSVNGISIDASHANRPANLGLGIRVKVEGTVANGTVVASKVEVENDSTVEAREFEFHDRVANLNTSTKTFSVKGYTVAYTDSTEFEPTQTTLANGQQVEVKAVIGADGQLTATKIELDSED